MPLYLKPPKAGRTPNWRIRGTYLGVRIDQSAGSTDRRVASQIMQRIKREIESGAIKPNAGPTFAGAVISYCRSRKVSTQTAKFLDKLLAYWGETFLDTITQSTLDECAATLYPGATIPTRNRQVYTPVSAVMKHAGVEKAFKRPKGSRGTPRPHWLTQEQAHRLLAACEAVSPRFGALCAFQLYTGARLSEALALDWQNVNLTAASAYMPHTKNGHSRLAHLPPVLVAELANLGPKETGKVFGYAKSGRLYKLLQRAEKASGVQIPEGISFHLFRHTYGAWMTRAGADLVATGAWKSRQAASVYEHLDATEEARKADLLPVRRVRNVGHK